MVEGALTLEYLLFFLEIIVLMFLLWHIRELSINSRELERVVKEMHNNHKEMHVDTRIIKESVDRLERDLSKLNIEHKKKKVPKKK